MKLFPGDLQGAGPRRITRSPGLIHCGSACCQQGGLGDPAAVNRALLRLDFDLEFGQCDLALRSTLAGSAAKACRVSSRPNR